MWLFYFLVLSFIFSFIFYNLSVYFIILCFILCSYGPFFFNVDSRACGQAWTSVVGAASLNYYTKREPHSSDYESEWVIIESLSQHQDLNLPICLQMSMLETSHQMNRNKVIHMKHWDEEKQKSYRWSSKVKTYDTK